MIVGRGTPPSEADEGLTGSLSPLWVRIRHWDAPSRCPLSAISRPQRLLLSTPELNSRIELMAGARNYAPVSATIRFGVPLPVARASPGRLKVLDALISMNLIRLSVWL